jgi:hypothetical protein
MLQGFWRSSSVTMGTVLLWWMGIASMVDIDCSNHTRCLLRGVWRLTSPELDADLAKA